MIKIERGIPIPAPKKAKTGVTDALRTMAVGDSFVIPMVRRENIFHAAAKVGIKVTIRKINLNELRVWRTK
jgi:hypothetical protein